MQNNIQKFIIWIQKRQTSFHQRLTKMSWVQNHAKEAENQSQIVQIIKFLRKQMDLQYIHIFPSESLWNVILVIPWF